MTDINRKHTEQVWEDLAGNAQSFPRAAPEAGQAAQAAYIHALSSIDGYVPAP